MLARARQITPSSTLFLPCQSNELVRPFTPGIRARTQQCDAETEGKDPVERGKKLSGRRRCYAAATEARPHLRHCAQWTRT